MRTKITYRNWTIEVDFAYQSGKFDFNIFPPDGEPGFMMPYTTIEMAEADIDERISDNEYQTI